ncbi:unnamed protein product [Didymodactylos carnosus]|uniref:HECT domain-containing protein n=1 Tax=Didymodactylos carnosus TaxID=1234261 RepID=A0A814FZ67_9BILA|nr:unnamed protein product [Didymodactylos carnosus]CAF3761096.1 unnamed protein product [Didymodactylos carnosus]
MDTRQKTQTTDHTTDPNCKLLDLSKPEENDLTNENELDSRRKDVHKFPQEQSRIFILQLYKNASLSFRKLEHVRVWTVTYVGMHSSDSGGLYRDSITAMCADICSTRLPLFILCPNGRTNSGLNRDRWIQNVFPSQTTIPSKIKNFYIFIGQLMGMAIQTKNLLNLQFPSLLWKPLVRQSVTVEDIEAIDMQSFTTIYEKSFA